MLNSNEGITINKRKRHIMTGSDYEALRRMYLAGHNIREIQRRLGVNTLHPASWAYAVRRQLNIPGRALGFRTFEAREKARQKLQQERQIRLSKLSSLIELAEEHLRKLKEEYVMLRDALEVK